MNEQIHAAEARAASADSEIAKLNGLEGGEA